MLEQLTSKLEQFKQRDNQKLFMLAGSAIVITALIIFFMVRGSQNYTALFGNQERVPVGQVIEVLSGESIPYRVEPATGQILVQENNLSKARMILASQGVKTLQPEGYELMDKEALLGSSQFMQNVRYRRSLEGELAQSIMALAPVAYARVHLGVSESSSFVLNNQPKSSASVIVRLHYGKQLADEQIGAIIQLVSGSTPGLSPANVQVVDQEGRLLSDRYQAEDTGLFSMKNSTELVKGLQNDIEKNVAHLLASLVGANNYRISVMPQLDLSRIEETQERYGTEPKINAESINQENMGSDVAEGVPGSLSNRPGTRPAATTNNTTQSTRNQSDRRFAYDRDIRHIRYPGFKIEKMSVAIILNRDAPELEGWTDAQLDELNKLITDAAGIDVKRGDSLSLSLMKFTQPTMYDEPVMEWWENPTIMNWAEKGGIGLLALLLLLFGINPLLRRLGQPAVQKIAAVTENNGADSIEDNQYHDSNNSSSDAPKKTFQHDANLPPQSSGLETKTEYLQMLAEIETERVAEVIKQWINTNDRNTAKS